MHLILLAIRVFYDEDQLRHVEEDAGVGHDVLVFHKTGEDRQSNGLIKPWRTAGWSLLIITKCFLSAKKLHKQFLALLLSIRDKKKYPTALENM